MQKVLDLVDESQTVALGRSFAESLLGSSVSGLVVYLGGTLGAGKTTFCRGVLQALGHSGAVKSPTYTLVEPYKLVKIDVYHFDLYRLSDPEELEYMGVRDYFDDRSLCLVEWSERGCGALAEPDVSLQLDVSGQGRVATLTSVTTKGATVLEACGASR